MRFRFELLPPPDRYQMIHKSIFPNLILDFISRQTMFFLLTLVLRWRCIESIASMFKNHKTEATSKEKQDAQLDGCGKKKQKKKEKKLEICTYISEIQLNNYEVCTPKPLGLTCDGFSAHTCDYITHRLRLQSTLLCAAHSSLIYLWYTFFRQLHQLRFSQRLSNANSIAQSHRAMHSVSAPVCDS